jgi:uncharacterized protein
VGLPSEFDSYAVVLLRRPRDARDLPSDEEERLQMRHVRYIMSLVESGAAYAGGPLLDGSDPSLVGLMIFRAPLEEARGLADEDPKVRAGQLVAETFMWSFPAGQLDFERAVERED